MGRRPRTGAGETFKANSTVSPPVFTKEEAWLGGSYDLAIELGASDDTCVLQSLQAIWSSPDLDGCYLHSDREPHEQTRTIANVHPLGTRLYGVARIGGRPPVPCSTIVVRTERESDWIFFYLPIASLASIYPVGAFPIADGGDLAWRSSLDEWLCAIGRRAFEAVPFRLGLVGFDGGDFSDAAAFASSGVPDERWIGYLVPETGGLKWFAPNRGAPIDFAAAPSGTTR